MSKLRILDLALAVLTLAYGLWAVVVGWPEPGFWGWTALVGGAVAIPFSLYDPMGRVSRNLSRRVVKKV